MSLSSADRPLHVGVNLLWLVPGVVGGSEEYTTRALLALAERDDPDLRVTLFALSQFAEAVALLDVADLLRIHRTGDLDAVGHGVDA